MPKVPDGWPAAALPRRMTREWAAFYCGLSPNGFAAKVADNTFPKQDRDGRYDRKLLDDAIDRLNGLRAAEEESKDDWSVPPHPPRVQRAGQRKLGAGNSPKPDGA